MYRRLGLTTATRQTTSEGFELSYVTNFLSQFLLTTLLLHRGDFAPNARIVQCSSLAAFNSGPLTPEDVNSVDLLGKLKEGDQIAIGPGFKVYGRSKAMQIIFSRELAEALSRSSQWSDVVVHSCHPGERFYSISAFSLLTYRHAKVRYYPVSGNVPKEWRHTLLPRRF